ncbi:hypothetical protein TNCV_881051 [Trichonephila clavipes]|nr:hypothetical protein TNCV_881051 [Trichonephila clavipes]
MASWFGRESLSVVTSCGLFRSVLTDVRYRNDILDRYTYPYDTPIGNEFILMDANARPQRTVLVGVNGMAGPSPDVNPIEHGDRLIILSNIC